MRGYFEIRTDLALEAKENLEKGKEELAGIHVREERDDEHRIHTFAVTFSIA